MKRQHTAGRRLAWLAITSALCLLLHLVPSAPAAAAERAAVGNDGSDWPSDVVRIQSTVSNTVGVGPAGAAMHGTPPSGSPSLYIPPSVPPHAFSPGGAARVTPKTDPAPIDYCLQVTVSEPASATYSLHFHWSGAGSGASFSPPPPARRPAPGTLRQLVPAALDSGTGSLTFALTLSSAAAISSSGSTEVTGAIYDSSSTLVAADDPVGGPLSTDLSATQYTLVLSGGDWIAGEFSVVADTAACAP